MMLQPLDPLHAELLESVPVHPILASVKIWGTYSHVNVALDSFDKVTNRNLFLDVSPLSLILRYT